MSNVEQQSAFVDPEKSDDYSLLFSHEEIQQRVDKLASQIVHDYQKEEVEEVVAISILDGASFFAVDLVRKLNEQGLKKLRMEFIGVSSYQGTRSTKQPVLTKELRREIQGQHVLIIEDVLDRGYTLDFVKRKLEGSHPADLKIAVLLSKASGVREVDVPVDYIAFPDVDGYVIGYGFDIDGYYRPYQDIWVKKNLK